MKNKLMAISVVLLFLFVITSMLSAQPLRRPGAFWPGLGPRWQEWLGLTADQKSKIESLRQTHQKEMQGLWDKLAELQKQLREARQDPKADPKKIDSLIDEIFKLRAAQMKARIKHQAEIEKVLTKEQKDKLDQAKQRMSRFLQSCDFCRGLGFWRPAPIFPGRPLYRMHQRWFPRWWR